MLDAVRCSLQLLDDFPRACPIVTQLSNSFVLFAQLRVAAGKYDISNFIYSGVGSERVDELSVPSSLLLNEDLRNLPARWEAYGQFSRVGFDCGWAGGKFKVFVD